GVTRSGSRPRERRTGRMTNTNRGVGRTGSTRWAGALQPRAVTPPGEQQPRGGSRMTKRMWSAALALSLAGGVYLAASAARASNMGFKLERDFDFKRTSAAGSLPLQNIYYVSIPFFNGLGDVADGVAINPANGNPYANKCVG